MENTRNIDAVLADMNAQVGLGTAAIRGNDLTALNAANTELKKLEKEYDAFVLQQLYARLNATEDPILSAITEFTYDTKKSREVKTDGIATALEIVDVTKRINLLAFCKQVEGADTMWQYDAQKLNKALALRAANELKLDKTAVDTLKSTFQMHTSVAKDKVTAPTSNNQIIKMLQNIVDKIVYDDDGSNKNKYKVTSHDVAHLLMTYAQRDSKNALAVRVSKHKALIDEIATVCHKIVAGKTYELIYKQLKNS